MRQCIACRERCSKSSLARLSIEGSQVILDRRARVQSRGAYIHFRASCIVRLGEKRRLERGLRSQSKVVSKEELSRITAELLGHVVERV